MKKRRIILICAVIAIICGEIGVRQYCEKQDSKAYRLVWIEREYSEAEKIYNRLNSLHYYDEDEYNYNMVAIHACGIAERYYRTLMYNFNREYTLKNPKSFSINSIGCVVHDDDTFDLKMEYFADNSFGGSVRSTYTLTGQKLNENDKEVAWEFQRLRDVPGYTPDENATVGYFVGNCMLMLRSESLYTELEQKVK